jgi:hypothetical protein
LSDQRWRWFAWRNLELNKRACPAVIHSQKR